MKKNIGIIDKIIRLLIVITITVFYFSGFISGTTAVIFGIIAVVFLITAFMGFCPLYLPLNINTANKRKK